MGSGRNEGGFEGRIEPEMYPVGKNRLSDQSSDPRPGQKTGLIPTHTFGSSPCWPWSCAGSSELA